MSADYSTEIEKIARRCAFLGAHVTDRIDGEAMLIREATRLYHLFTARDDDEPDLTFCCGCREEIEAGQEQWVLDGAKYHEACYRKAQTVGASPKG
jgi:hypothetical protein